ncbi:MAG: hypothetical protein K9G80_10215 [Candidatus Nanopelagicales bacterium]|nr:hypothetical protein [Candidatus Nanopelagicales bacterium]MCF8538177.1 hypothetical protein [Candidatus Nanopelagicales bacterium]MCF8558194.1 hypothetical protein [Candidatus Nanopelagicales bacterium]
MSVVCIPVTADGHVGHSWGEAPTVALASVDDSGIVAWVTHDVSWDASHDAGPHGTHHARIARFLREEQVTDVIVDHLGDPMGNMLAKMSIKVHTGYSGDARRACLEAIS